MGVWYCVVEDEVRYFWVCGLLLMGVVRASDYVVFRYIGWVVGGWFRASGEGVLPISGLK